MNGVSFKSYGDIAIDLKDVLYYAGRCEETLQTVSLADECIDEARAVFKYNLCFAKCKKRDIDGGVDLGFAKVFSKDLKKNLQKTDDVIVFAASVGLGIDRLIAKYKTVSPARAFMLSAVGSAAVESLCDRFCLETENELKKSGGFIKPRFSAGYGDLPLEFQKDIFDFLDINKNIGVSLGENLLMSPSKSVTAIMGMGVKEE